MFNVFLLIALCWFALGIFAGTYEDGLYTVMGIICCQIWVVGAYLVYLTSKKKKFTTGPHKEGVVLPNGIFK